MSRYDHLIVGGGLVGLSIGYGLARRGLKVAILDEGDIAFRAARGNFGNIWVQGKGVDNPSYAAITRASAMAWREFADELAQTSGVDVRFRQGRAAFVCMSDQELRQRAAMLRKADEGMAISCDIEEICQADLRNECPLVGPAVAGATYSRLDGVVDPLRLLHALLVSFQNAGGRYIPGVAISAIARDGAGFAAVGSQAAYKSATVILCAGLGNAKLAPMLGLRAPVRPVKGQIIVTEKLKPFMPMTFHFIRQTDDGGVICGDSSEDVGFDESATPPILARTAKRLISVFPFMANVRMIRAWGALRVMTPDGFPIYQQSVEAPGAFVFSVHSGVTLTPFHANALAGALGDGMALPGDIAASFSPDRFHV